MGFIAEINHILDNSEKAKMLANRVIERAEKENRKFGDILLEELEKVKAIMDTGK